MKKPDPALWEKVEQSKVPLTSQFGRQPKYIMRYEDGRVQYYKRKK